MKKIRGLLYCCKAKPSLMKYENIDGYYTDADPVLDKRALLNGKIVAECDFVVEEITPSTWNAETERRILKGSCLKEHQLFDYIIKGDENESQNPFYAIHIKNLHIFDKPRELSEYYYYDDVRLTKAPQNMMYCYDNEGNKYVVISIQPQWMCLILNRIKDVDVRRKVLKEMLENE